jgi:hypothetical protein
MNVTSSQEIELIVYFAVTTHTIAHIAYKSPAQVPCLPRLRHLSLLVYTRPQVKYVFW